MRPQILVDGVWLTSICSWGSLVITDRWPGGNWEASWTIPVDRLTRYRPLRSRASVEIRLGGASIWAGYLTEPNWDMGEMTALGYVRQGEETVCLGSGGAASSTPDTAIDQGISRGALAWIRRSSISSTVFGEAEDTAQLNYVTALLDAYTQQAGTGWGVNARREVTSVADPTTPSVRLTPAAGVLGVADDVLAARVLGRYNSSTTGAPATAIVGTGAPEVAVALDTLGDMDSTKATSIITGIYNQLGARTGWANGITGSAGQVSSLGGSTCSLGAVSAGARGPIMMRLDGLRDLRGTLIAATDVIVAESIWNVDDGALTLNPKGLVARDLASIIEGAGAVQI